MGLISDRKSKAAKREKEHHFYHSQHNLNYHPVSGAQPVGYNGKNRKLYGPQVLPVGNNKQMLPQKYPAGYYTTPVNHSSSYNNHHVHPSQPKYQPNVNPRYQTWVAPRKQPSLGQLVRIRALTACDVKT